MSELFLNVWGSGVPVVLVHGSLASGEDEWQAQKPLADAGFQLLAPDRRGYGRSPSADGEDFLRDYLDAEYEAIRWSVGGYRIEGRGVQLFERIEGSHFAILGLPLLPLLAFLRERRVIAS